MIDPPPVTLAYLEETRAGIAANLAIDEALLDEAEDSGGPGFLRIWEAPTTAVVLGASCRLREDVHVEACQADGVPIARRSSGGGTVVIGPGALNVAVVLPIDAAPGLGAVDLAQRYVLGRIAAAIRELGPPVELLGSGDLTIGLRKFSGSAQRRLRRHFLVHASLLYRFPLEWIGRYTAPPRRQPAYRQGRSHEDFVTNLDLPRDRLIEAVRAAWSPLGSLPRSAALPEARVERLVISKLDDPGWIERL